MFPPSLSLGPTPLPTGVALKNLQHVLLSLLTFQVNPQLLTVKQWLLARQGKAGWGKDEWGGEGGERGGGRAGKGVGRCNANSQPLVHADPQKL